MKRTRDWLTSLRNANGMTMKQAASGLGISESYFCLLESGERQQDMTYSMMERLASALDVPVQRIIDAELAYKSALTDASDDETRPA